MDDGFIDLRSRPNDTLIDQAGFWPSFTDIMTVVVMIFLLTSMVMIVRNWELVDNLRASILASQKAVETARATARAKATVEQQLALAEQEIAELHTELDQLATEAERNARLLA